MKSLSRILVFAAAEAAGGAQRPPSISELAALKQFGNIQISPKSEDVVFTVQQPGEPTSIWLAPTRGSPKRLVDSPGAISNLAWFSDGTSIGYIQDGKLLRFKLPSGPPEAVDTTLARVTSWHSNPDGRRIVMIGERSTPGAPDPIVIGDSEPVDRATTSKALVSDSHRTGEREVDATHVLSARWSPDGNGLAIVSAEKPYLDWTQLQPRLSVWEDRTGKVTVACRTSGKLTTPVWSPDGRQIAFIGSSDDGRDFYPASLLVCDLSTSVKRDLAKDCHWTAESVRWSSMGLQWIGAYGGRRSLMSGTGCKTTEERLPGEVHFRTDWNVNESGSVALAVSNPSHPPQLVRVRRGAPAESLFTLDESLLGRAFPKASQVSWTSRDGMRITGVLLLPATYTNGQAIKTVVHLHGSNVGEALDFQASAMHWGQLLAAHGFAVLMVNYRGSPVSGGTFHRSWRGEMGNKDVEDVLAGANYVISSGIADPKALAITGVSYGAYLAGMAIARSPFFHSAVLLSGVYNYWSLHTGQTAAPRSAAVLEWGRNPFEIGEIIRERSPVTHARVITARTLLMCGKTDPVISYTQSVEFFRGLRSFGKTAELVVYPAEGHLISARANQADMFARIIDWLQVGLVDK